MSEFDFSSFLKSMGPGGGSPKPPAAEQPPPSTDEVPPNVLQSYAGRRLTFEEGNRMECDLEMLFPNEEDESLPQLLVRPVCHLNSDNAADADLPYAKQIAVNETFFCYALKSGDLRIISRVTNARVLVKTHEDDITGVHFVSPESNMLLIASMDHKISVLEVWEKDEEIEFRVMMCAAVDQEGPIRVAWGPTNDKLFVLSVQKWVVFVQWEKVVEGREGMHPFDIKCGECDSTLARFLKFDADVTFLKCRDNALIVGTADGMLQIWNFTADALAALFSEAYPEISNPVIKLKVTDGIPVRHVELFGDEIFRDASSANSFQFLTVNYASQSDPNTIILKSWNSTRTGTEFQSCPVQLLTLTVASVDQFTSLSVDYCRRENLLLMAERHWTSMLAIRCIHEEELKFECITKFPLMQEIVSMELSEKVSEEEEMENGIDVYCVQPMIIQHYILNPALCLPEIQEDEKTQTEALPDAEAVHPQSEVDQVPPPPATQDAAFFQTFIAERPAAETLPQFQEGLTTEVMEKPAAMPIPMPETDLELKNPRPPVLSVPTDPPTLTVRPETEAQATALSRTVSTAKSSSPKTPVSDGPRVSAGGSPRGSIHSRTRSDRNDSMQLGLDNNIHEPPSSVAQNVTAAAMHLLMVSQAERMPDPRPDKQDTDSDEPGLVTSERMNKDLHHFQNLSMMDSNSLPVNPDLSDLVETFERSISNVKRMIQVLEHKLGRAFHSVNKRLDVNFQDILTRLDSLQNPGNRGGHEDLDLRMREHATVAMQNMLDVMQSTIQTEIKNTLRAVVGGAIQRVFAEILSRQLSGLLNRCVENAISSSLSSAVNQGLQSNFRESFSDSIVPAFESAVQNMFGQIQSAFSAGLNEHLGQNPMMASQTNSILQNGINKLADFGEVALSDITVLKSTIANLSNDIHSMKQDIQVLLAATSSQQMSTPGGLHSMARATPDVVISEIFTLLKDEDYESAFNKALSLSRIDVLNRIINIVDYSALFASEPCPLSQSVLLSLLNQIGCDLVTDTETKLEWIRGAVTHLEGTPASPRVGSLTMGVLDYLIKKTQSMIKMGQISGTCLVSAKMTMNMLIGARNASFSP